jgi:hypothetical protein
MSNANKLTQFTFEDQPVPVDFVETRIVKEGVECDIYAFAHDELRDLVIVRVIKGFSTPLQRVLLGKKTIEGFLEGSGTLLIKSADNEPESYHFPNTGDNEIVVSIGQTMQWAASRDTDLVFYEVCEPRYEEGRFENLSEE